MNVDKLLDSIMEGRVSEQEAALCLAEALELDGFFDAVTKIRALLGLRQVRLGEKPLNIHGLIAAYKDAKGRFEIFSKDERIQDILTKARGGARAVYRVVRDLVRSVPPTEVKGI